MERDIKVCLLVMIITMFSVDTNYYPESFTILGGVAAQDPQPSDTGTITNGGTGAGTVTIVNSGHNNTIIYLQWCGTPTGQTPSDASTEPPPPSILEEPPPPNTLEAQPPPTSISAPFQFVP
ncbi:hypothetical protein MKW92_033306, partial [Papaver armeniacum]